jgi:tetratricopeptide (TPR) repeat protein
VLLGLWAFHLFRGELEIARELSEQCLVVVAAYPESPLRGWAHLAAGVSLFWLGRLPEARRELEQSLALYDVEEQGPLATMYGQDCGATCLAYLAVLCCPLGAPDLAAARAQQAVTLAESLDHSYTVAAALTMAAAVHHLRREPRQARQRAEAALALATEKGFPTWRWMAMVFRGWALTEEGLDEGIDEIRRGVTGWRSLGSELACPWFLTVLAEALGKRGRIDEGLEAVTESLELAARRHDRWYEAESHRVHGALLMAGGRTAEAEKAVRRALDIAHERGAASIELRAALTLGRLLETAGGRDEARRLLAEARARLTEGFDTPDLVDARARLAELS